jgi:hypothetical protein
MLPAWATVAVALGGALIGALTGLTASYLSSRSERQKLLHEESAAWRTVLIGACQGLSDAWLELRWVLYEPSEGLDVFDDEVKARLDPAAKSCAQAVAKVRLVFGNASPAGKAATALDDSVDRLKHDALRLRRPWDEAATTSIKTARLEAEGAHGDFLEKAHEAIRVGSVAEAMIAASVEKADREKRRRSLGWRRFYRRK